MASESVMKPCATPGGMISSCGSPTKARGQSSFRRSLSPSNINNHIVSRAAHTADQLPLGFGSELIVESSQRASRRSVGNVCLDHPCHQPALAELAFAELTREETAIVLYGIRGHDIGPRKRRFLEGHDVIAGLAELPGRSASRRFLRVLRRTKRSPSNAARSKP